MDFSLVISNASLLTYREQDVAIGLTEVNQPFSRDFR
jgi:hypothetical protein